MTIKNTITITSGADFLSKYVSTMHVKLLTGLIHSIESFYIKNKSPRAILKLLQSFKDLTHIDLMAPVYTNGTVIHFKTYCPQFR